MRTTNVGLCVCAPGTYTFTRESVGTRYAALIVRVFVDPNDPDDLAAAHAVQNAIQGDKRSIGSFKVRARTSGPSVRCETRCCESALLCWTQLAPGWADGGFDPIRRLISTAASWGCNTPRDASYVAVFPAQNDGTTSHRLSVTDLPVDGFWSISVYNAEGFFEPNEPRPLLRQHRDGGPPRGRLGHHQLWRRLGPTQPLTDNPGAGITS
jgi:hypothetical protein